ncbi:MAG: TetR/AcrR family transcriptional regulator [Mariprofundaceae bacterium]|nr:TetR/AcrR family transcriptional regulator [Mariprofundaceae bacterium]
MSSQRQRILTTTIDLIESEGLKAVSARKIASKIPCAVGSLYRYFDNLQSIFLAINIETLQALEISVQHYLQNNTSHVREHIRWMSMAYIDYVLSHPQRWQLVMQDFQSNHKDDNANYLAQRQHLFHLIEIELSQLHPNQTQAWVHLEALTLWAGVEGLCHLVSCGKIEREGKEGVKLLADVLLHRFLGDES